MERKDKGKKGCRTFRGESAARCFVSSRPVIAQVQGAKTTPQVGYTPILVRSTELFDVCSICLYTHIHEIINFLNKIDQSVVNTKKINQGGFHCN